MVSHLQFVDDTILFLGTDANNIRSMGMFIKIFELISGLKVNMSKSCMVGINMKDQSLRELASVVGCVVDEWSIKVFGITSVWAAPIYLLLGPGCEKGFKETCMLEEVVNFSRGKNYFDKSSST